MMFTPLIITVSVLITFIVLEVIIDTIRNRRVKKVSNHLLEIGKRQSLTTISVVIRPHGTQQRTTNLLDHLRACAYDKLQVVVVPRTRDAKRSAYLTRYRAAHPELDLRIVRSKGPRDDRTISTRHARGELIVWMDVTDRLSGRFFERLCYEFADPAIGRVDIPYRYETARTIADLLAAWSLIRRETFDLIRHRAGHMRHPVYRRTAFKRKSHFMAVKAGTPLSFIRPRESPNLLNYIVIIGNLIVALALGYAMLYYLNTEWIFTVVAVLAAYLLSNYFWLTSSKRYTLPEAVALILALPFAVLGNFIARFRQS